LLDPIVSHRIRCARHGVASNRATGPNVGTWSSTTSDKTKPAPKDAIALLKSDHEAVSELFAEYEKTRASAKKKALIAEICTALSVHAQIEEEIF